MTHKGMWRIYSNPDPHMSPISRLLRHTRECRGPFLTRILTGFQQDQNQTYLFCSKPTKIPDDCGVWGRSGRTVNSRYFLQDNKLRNVVLRNNVYCVEKKVQGQRTFVPLELQPTDDAQILHKVKDRWWIPQKSHNIYKVEKHNIAYVEYQSVLIQSTDSTGRRWRGFIKNIFSQSVWKTIQNTGQPIL